MIIEKARMRSIRAPLPHLDRTCHMNTFHMNFISRFFGAAALAMAVSTAFVGNASATASPSAGGAAKKHVCWDFSDLTIGARYQTGDVITARNAVIRIRDYRFNGNPLGDPDLGVFVVGSTIAGGVVPELRTYGRSTLVTPDKPIRKVTMKIAENTGGTGAHANIEVNGDFHEIAGGLATANGRVIGNAAKGTAEVVVNMTPSASGTWNIGTLELRARQGKIESYSVSGIQVLKDDECIWK
jgi:hypothetical protein